MTCRQCQAETHPGRRFCFNCGAVLVAPCGECGFDNEAGDRFCVRCGRSLPAAAAAGSATRAPRARAMGGALISPSAREGERKQVTILFADVKDSMALLAGRDPEEARKILDPALALMMDAVHEFDGTVNQVMGDGVMALFGAPVALEDHAVRACHAALRMQADLRRYGAEVRERLGADLGVRIGLNSGEVVVRAIGRGLATDYTAIGESTHLAGRMEQLARAGSIFMTAHVARLAEGHVQAVALGELPVKGLAGPVAVYELQGLTGARSRLDVAMRRGLTRFSGRDAEMADLAAAVERARGGRGQVVAIVGEPGVGKSRLLWELLRSHHLRGFEVLRASAAPYGERWPYLPVTELLRAALGIAAADDAAAIRERIGRALSPEETARFLTPILALLDVPVDDPRWPSLDASQRRRRTIEAVRYLLTSRARQAPVCVAVEDAQWIDAETEAVLDGLVESAPLARLLLLVTYRPEWQHGWASKSYYAQVRVNPLAPSAADALLDALMGAAPGLAAVKQVLIERTQGNPFFLEESVRNLAEHDVLAGGRGAYRLARPPEGTHIPENVHAVLAGRIDRLSAADKQVLQAAAAIGKDVPRRLLEAAADVAAADLEASLGRLQSREFLHEAALDPERAYAFTHALTQEVAYAGLVRDRRHALHARILAALEGPAGAGVADVLHHLSHHAVHAERWDKALRYCREAGARAFTRSAHRGAALYLRQALAALEHLPPTRETAEQAIDVRLDLRHALSPLGEYRQIFETLTEAERLAAGLGDERRRGAIASFLCNTYTLRGDFPRAVEHGERAASIAAGLGDRALEAVARATLALAHWGSGDYPRAIATGRRTVELDDPSHRGHFGIAVPPAVYGRTVTAWALSEIGGFAEARQLAEDALGIARALDHPHSVIFASIGLGVAHLRRGDACEALEVLERAHAVWRTTDLPAVLVELVGTLASAATAAGRVERAIALLDEAIAQAVALGHPFGHLLRTGHMAEAHLAAGRAEQALPLAQLHVEITRRARLRGSEGWALRLLADVQAHREHPDADAAEQALTQALALADALGMGPLAACCHLTRAVLSVALSRTAEATAAAAKALQGFRSLDMPALAARAEALLERG